MPLTVNQIKNAKPGPKRRVMFDGGGLHIEISPKGVKTWKLQYRVGDRRNTITLGQWSDYSLAEAREWRENVKSKVRAGEDPAAEARRAKRERPLAETFEEVAREWHERQKVKWNAVHAGRVLGRLENDVFPLFGNIPVNEVSHRDCLDLIERIEGRGAYETTRKVMQYIGRVMKYAIATERAEHNPASNVRDAMSARPKVEHFAKMPRDRFPDFFARLAASQHERVTKCAIRWTLLTWARSGETRFFRPDEIEGRGTKDLLWRIPGDRMKMGRDHLVPLPTQAVPLLEEIEFYARKEKSPWQFPQVRNPQKALDPNVMIYCLYDLGFKGIATMHGFRGVASTLLNEQTDGGGHKRFDKDWIEMQLAHAEESDVRGAYNAAEYIGPRRKMMQWWADWLEDQEAMGALL